MLRRILLVFSDRELRNKLLKIIGLLVVARLLTQIPLPALGVRDVSSLVDNNAVFQLLNTISGGGYGTLSFVMLGISPYITASIVFQLLGVIIPKINQIKKEEGEAGRQKINRWTRLLVVPLAALNAWGILRYMANTPVSTGSSEMLLPENFINGGSWIWLSAIIALTAGSIIMMWIGEIITEYKMGNGISILILAGIVSSLPSAIAEKWPDFVTGIKAFFEKFEFSYLFNGEAWSNFWSVDPEWYTLRSVLILVVTFLTTLMFVVFINDAIRKLEVVYSRRGHGEGNSRTLSHVKADLPIKVNVAGVIPIIFAVSFILFPSVIATFLSTSNLTTVKDGAAKVQTFLSAQPTGVQEPDLLSNEGVLGFYLVDSQEKLVAASNYDKTEGADLFGYTINNFENSNNCEGDTKTKFFDGTFFSFSLPCKKVSFLPEFGMHWNGASAYNFFYFFLVVFFTYFYTKTVAFKTEDVAENLQKSGAYIPGSKPGKETEKYLDYVSNRLNVVGSLFLAIIAIFPILISMNVNFNDSSGTLSSIVGGTTLLILVSVSIDALRQIDAQATAVDYERFTKY